MINFRITDIQGGMLTIDRPAGQAISLKLAEIVRAQVMEILPSGAVALRVKGEPLIAKTQVPLQPGTTAFFKVTGIPTEGKDLTLQFLGLASQDQMHQQPLQTEARQQHLTSLMKEFQSLLEQMRGSKTEQTSRMTRLQELNSEILKSLPSDTQRLPKELKAQIQDLLLGSLRLTGNSIQSKMADLIKSLPSNMPHSSLIENLKKDISVSVDRLLNSSLKVAIQDTGVALEAKIKGIAQGLATTDQSGKAQGPASTGDYRQGNAMADILSTKTQQGEITQTDRSPFQNDLKAKLLQMRETIGHTKALLERSIEPAEPQRPETASVMSKIAASETTLNRIDNLLKDIETFQTISKATNSFFTFLPLDWKGLKDGDISFKKGKGRAGGSSPYSCRVNLDLDELGPLGLIVMKYGNDFYVSFKVKDEAFKSALKGHLSELAESFSARGMSLRSARVFDYDDKDGFEDIEEIASSEGGINITV